MGVLLAFNRSPRIPGWVSAAIFIALMILIATQSDTPQELYGGRSLMYWVIPIMISAIILPPESVFLIAALISGLLLAFSHNNLHGSADYYAMVGFFLIAFLSWLGMRIANRAIRDARGQAANLEAILNSIADGVLVLDLQGSFLSANPALLRMIPEDKLKEIVSDDFIGGVVKYQNEFSVENFLHVFACSNSMRALKFEDSDRRWLIPEVTEEAKPHSYWKKLYAWLNAGGYAVIAHWAQDYVKRHGHVQKGEHAPSTERKREAIMQSRSDGERYIAELGEALKRIDGQALMRLDHVRAWLITKKAASPQLYGVDGRRFLETPETISKVLRGCGLQLPKRQHEKGAEKFRVVANFAIPGAATWARDLEGLCRQPADVAPF